MMADTVMDPPEYEPQYMVEGSVQRATAVIAPREMMAAVT